MFTNPSGRQTRRRMAAAPPNNAVQFCSNGTQYGDTNLTWNNSTEILTVGNSSSVGNITVTTASIVVGNSTINVVSNSTAISYNSGVTVVNSTSFTNTGATTNGSFILPNGFVMQYGKAVTNSTGVNVVTFATAFTTNAFSIALTPIGPGSRATVIALANNITKTGFTIYTTVANSTGSAVTLANTGCPGVYFTAIGS